MIMPMSFAMFYPFLIRRLYGLEAGEVGLRWKI